MCSNFYSKQLRYNSPKLTNLMIATNYTFSWSLPSWPFTNRTALLLTPSNFSLLQPHFGGLGAQSALVCVVVGSSILHTITPWPYLQLPPATLQHIKKPNKGSSSLLSDNDDSAGLGRGGGSGSIAPTITQYAWQVAPARLAASSRSLVKPPLSLYCHQLVIISHPYGVFFNQPAKYGPNEQGG